MTLLQEASKAKENAIKKQIKSYLLQYTDEKSNPDTDIDHMTESLYAHMEKMDPTPSGKYLQFLSHQLLRELKTYKSQAPMLKMLNATAIHHALSKFHKGKHQFKGTKNEKYINIANVKSQQDFLNFIKAIETIVVKEERDEALKKYTEKIYSDKDYSVFLLKDFQVMKYICGGTKWCLTNFEDYSRYAGDNLVTIIQKNISSAKDKDGMYQDPLRKLTMAIDSTTSDIREFNDAHNNPVVGKVTIPVEIYYKIADVLNLNKYFVEDYVFTSVGLNRVTGVTSELFLQYLRPYISNSNTAVLHDRVKHSLSIPIETAHSLFPPLVKYSDRLKDLELSDFDALFEEIEQDNIRYQFLKMMKINYPKLFQMFIDRLIEEGGITFEQFSDENGIDLDIINSTDDNKAIDNIIQYLDDFDKADIIATIEDALVFMYHGFVRLTHPLKYEYKVHDDNYTQVELTNTHLKFTSRYELLTSKYFRMIVLNFIIKRSNERDQMKKEGSVIDEMIKHSWWGESIISEMVAIPPKSIKEDFVTYALVGNTTSSIPEYHAKLEDLRLDACEYVFRIW